VQASRTTVAYVFSLGRDPRSPRRKMPRLGDESHKNTNLASQSRLGKRVSPRRDVLPLKTTINLACASCSIKTQLHTISRLGESHSPKRDEHSPKLQNPPPERWPRADRAYASLHISPRRA